jgi:predicted AAA+ superfamily ATPase
MIQDEQSSPYLLPRRAEQAIEEALADTRVVLVNGIRQAGKSTLARIVANRRSATFRNLDVAVDRTAAQDDPEGFIDLSGLVVIDEIQRVPELLLAIKADVDAHPIPGRFLLTGSSRVLAMRDLPDTLPGRMETIELWPLSQGEIDSAPDRFVDTAFKLGPELRHTSTLTRADYANRVVRGGLPEAVRRSGRRRSRYFDSYLDDLLAREIRMLSEIEYLPQLRMITQLIAARNANLLVQTNLATQTGLSRQTVGRYVSLLAEIFAIRLVPAWSRNLGSRAVATPKAVISDSGLAANLSGMEPESLLLPGAPFGMLLEGFVLMELARQLTWSDTQAELFHYRTKDKVEVDAVLENRAGKVVAIEVKAASTVRGDDFNGIRHLERRIGDDLVAGYVLYTGKDTLPFGPKLRAVPVSALWQA